MAYALLVRGRIAPGRHDEALKVLNDQILPMVKGAPGFIRGTWFGDAESGNAVVIFESEEQAQQMVNIKSSPDDAMQVESVTVYEVHAEA